MLHCSTLKESILYGMIPVYIVGFTKYSHYFYLQDEHFNKLQRESSGLAGTDCHYRGNGGLLESAAAACHRTKRHKTKSTQQPVKNEIQVVF